MIQTIAAIKSFITNINLLSYLLPLVFFLLFKLHTKEKALRVIFFYFFYSFLNELVGFALHKKGIYISDFSIPIFTVVEFSLFSVFFYYSIKGNKLQVFILPVSIAFFLLAIIDFFLINKMEEFDSVPAGIEAILIILMCIYYLFIQIKGVNDLFVYSTSNFWIMITFLIYISGTFFIYIMAEKYMNIKAFVYQYIIINDIFNVIKNVLFCIAMLMKPSNNNRVQATNKDWDDFLTYNLNS